MTETSAGLSVDNALESRRAIADLIRAARNERGLSQAALGAQIGVSRYVINRIEGTNQDLSLEHAAKLAEFLDRPALEELARAQFASPVRTVESPSTRDALLEELLKSRGLDRLIIVLADELDIVSLLANARINLPERVTIVFPSHARQQQLRGMAVPTAATWDVQRQITRIFEALAVGGRLHPDEGPLDYDIKLYESDDVRQSFVLVGTAAGNQCAVWPALPNIQPDQFETIPAAVSAEAAFIQVIEAHYRDLVRDRMPLTHLKAVVVVDESNESTPAGPAARHRLSSYFQLGIDAEKDAARRGGGATGGFGFGVALVLVHGYAERPGRPLGRRVLLQQDAKSATYQLVSSHVSDEDLVGDGQRGPRSTSTSHEARRKLIAGDREASVNSDAFSRAARHGLLDEFGADVPVGALQEIALPEPLWIVEKIDPQGHRLMPVVPRLFHLDLTPRNREDLMARIEASGQKGDPAQLVDDWLASVGRLEAALLDAGDTMAFGQQDLRDQDVKLNDFLDTARVQAGDWFFSVLEELEIVKD
ncbi:helix-turn-helix domain-containing protein [Kribbella sp. NPDC051952]|uniref:helix-turn-helix transcriptional regulator n=1 Tax=Kribbella sp. NPDC051952 TaxID=3154851 RepID=UPI0034462E9F